MTGSTATAGDRIWDSYILDGEVRTGELLFVDRGPAERNLEQVAEGYHIDFDADDLEQVGENCWRYEIDERRTAVLVHAAVHKEVPSDGE